LPSRLRVLGGSRRRGSRYQGDAQRRQHNRNASPKGSAPPVRTRNRRDQGGPRVHLHRISPRLSRRTERTDRTGWDERSREILRMRVATPASRVGAITARRPNQG
jgi:hypothetical protein